MKRPYLSCSGVGTHPRDCRRGRRKGTWRNGEISHTEAKIMGLVMIRCLQEGVKGEPECRRLNLIAPS